MLTTTSMNSNLSRLILDACHTLTDGTVVRRRLASEIETADFQQRVHLYTGFRLPDSMRFHSVPVFADPADQDACETIKLTLAPLREVVSCFGPKKKGSFQNPVEDTKCFVSFARASDLPDLDQLRISDEGV
jgi:hypothetical protein